MAAADQRKVGGTCLREADRSGFRHDWILKPALLLAFLGSLHAAAEVLITDRFGRDLSTEGVTLIDWEGQIANPAIEIFVSPPEGVPLPANVALSADGSRIYFGNPSTISANGPRKELFFRDANPIAVLISTFPDRDYDDEAYVLTAEYTDPQLGTRQTRIPVNVVDQDIDRALEFSISVEFNQDQSRFFEDEAARAVVNQAADDWAYFIADMDLEPVAELAESTFIWSWPLAWTGSPQGTYVQNQSQYVGYLLYSYGVRTVEVRSGGAPSACCFQISNGNPVPLRRSGGIQMEIRGNYNVRGWLIDLTDASWTATSLAGETADFYSIAHHEIGHAIGFNSQYPVFADLEVNDADSPAIIAYHGTPVEINSFFDHLDGIVDPASRRGAFGNEYYGDVPRHRWLITKLDLLILESLGYELRQTSAMEPLSFLTESLAPGTENIAYSSVLELSGGIAFYDFSIADGALPSGLSLNRFSGEVSGIPESSGEFGVVILGRDYSDGPGVEMSFTIRIEDPDVDDDGVPNDQDPFPNDPSEWLDRDGDGIGNNADADDDNDGLSDSDEISIHGTDPLSIDTDRDGIADGDEIVYGSDPLVEDCSYDLCPPSGGVLNIVPFILEREETQGDRE